MVYITQKKYFTSFFIAKGLLKKIRATTDGGEKSTRLRGREVVPRALNAVGLSIARP